MLNRRRFLAAVALPAAPFAQTGPYQANWESLKAHPLPAWFAGAKLGIFVHYGLYSVPAYAPPTGELGKVDWNTWFYKNPYAEWYLNSIRLKDSDTSKWHAAKYGAAFDYYGFAAEFNRENAKWEPGEWAALFRQAGARYAVLTTKHHDGFTLWPSKVRNPVREGLTSTRDIVGDFAKAVRAAGMRMGLYYSGGLDWTFESKPVAKMADLRTTAPKSQAYADYADAHWRELIDRYQPDVLWNDIGYPPAGQLTSIFADYYNRFPEGVVNNRFGAPHADFTTPEYSTYEKAVEKKWESCRGLGFSFGYNQMEDGRHVIAADKLIDLLVDIVAKNGNLLLNVGPRPDGSISEIQMDRLRKLGAWMRVNAEGIHDTRPWKTAGVKNAAGEEIRYTAKGKDLYAFVLGRPKSQVVVLPGAVAAGDVELLGSGGRLPVKSGNEGLTITLPARTTEFAVGMRIRGGAA